MKKKKKAKEKLNKKLGRRSNVKGKTFEREVANKLKAWYGKPFQRIPNSGALRWNNNIFTFGDILPPEEFRCIIECKHHMKIELFHLFTKQPDKKSSDPMSWFKCQLLVDIDRCKENTGEELVPLLIFKKTRQTTIVMTYKELFDDIDVPGTALTISKNNMRDLIMVEFKNFLKINPRSFDGACRKFTS